MNILEKKKKLHGYIKACDDYLAAYEELVEIVKQLGSDPLGILDQVVQTVDLEALKPEVEQPVETELPEPSGPPVADEAELHRLQESGALDQKPEVAQEPEKAPSDDERQFRRHADKERIEKNVMWLYEQLINGPVAGNTLKLRAKRVGITEYAMRTARRYVNDIHIKTVGFRGPQYWYIAGDESKLPKMKDPREIRKEVGKNGKMNEKDKAVLNILRTAGDTGATIAELIGKTRYSPPIIRETLERLSAMKVARNTQINHTNKWVAVAV